MTEERHYRILFDEDDPYASEDFEMHLGDLEMDGLIKGWYAE